MKSFIGSSQNRVVAIVSALSFCLSLIVSLLLLPPSGVVASPTGSTTRAHLLGAVTGGADLSRMASTPDGQGYWISNADGSVYSFGDAQFYGSMGGHPLNKPVVGMASTSDGLGYWLVASDGGIFSFGDARFYGSMPNVPPGSWIDGVQPTPDGNGYWLVSSSDGVYTYGDAQFYGVPGASTPSQGQAPSSPSGSSGSSGYSGSFSPYGSSTTTVPLSTTTPIDGYQGIEVYTITCSGTTLGNAAFFLTDNDGYQGAFDAQYQSYYTDYPTDFSPIGGNANDKTTDLFAGSDNYESANWGNKITTIVVSYTPGIPPKMTYYTGPSCVLSSPIIK